MAKTDVRQQLRKLTVRNTELHGQLAFWREYARGLNNTNKQLRAKLVEARQESPWRFVLRLTLVLVMTFGAFCLYPVIGNFVWLYVTGFTVLLFGS